MAQVFTQKEKVKKKKAKKKATYSYSSWAYEWKKGKAGGQEGGRDKVDLVFQGG